MQFMAHSNHQQRIEKVQDLLKQNSLDALLISNPHNIFYLTGFIGLAPEDREAFTLVTKKDTYLITSKLYTPSFPNTRFLESDKRLTRHLSEIITAEGVTTIGVESQDLTVAEFDAIKKNLARVDFSRTHHLIEDIRKVKDADEIALIRKACRLSDDCLSTIVPTIKMGQTEGEIAFKIEMWIQEKGYQHAFAPIVAVDRNSAVPHHASRSSKTKVGPNSQILIDMGVEFGNYQSDITRMFFVGKPSKKAVEVYSKLLDAQEKTIALLTSGAACLDVDTYCRDLLTGAGMPTYPHVTGHGLGIEVHEEPRVTIKSEEMLRTNNVITIEPGVYYEKEFGMRIEDTVLITKNGYEILTKYPKHLQQI